MSDYANLREQYYLLLNTPPDPPADIMAAMDNERQTQANRNPDQPIDQALLRARNQAEWHAAQQAILDADTPDLERYRMEHVMSGGKVAEIGDDPDLTMQSKHREQAAEDLEMMRSGDYPPSNIGVSSPQAASLPGYVVPPEVQPTPPVMPTAADLQEEGGDTTAPSTSTTTTAPTIPPQEPEPEPVPVPEPPPGPSEEPPPGP